MSRKAIHPSSSHFYIYRHALAANVESHVAIEAIGKLVRYENALSTLAEHDCNVGLSPRQQKRQERLEEQARIEANRLELVIECNRDPRGACVQLYPSTDRAKSGSYWSVY